MVAGLKERGRLTADGDLVFTREGEHQGQWILRERYYAALKRAGLRRLRFHDLPHAFGWAAITRLDPHAVQSYMGHQHYSTTQRYLHHQPRREDAAQLAEAFGPDGNPAATPDTEGNHEPGTNPGTKLGATEGETEQDHAPERA
jgi:hypothetical protein